MLFRIAAVTLACVFASLPTLTRLHARVSTRDDMHRFRLSKNLDRPHEKVGVGPLAVTLTSRVEQDPSVRWLVVETFSSAISNTLVSHLTSRAPPIG